MSIRQQALKALVPGLFKLRDGCECGSKSQLRWSERAFLAKFNCVWPEIIRDTPFWRGLPAPPSIRSYDAFRNLPLISRAQIQADPPGFFRRQEKPVEFASTGGSLGRPLRFPLLRTELEIGRQNQALGRSKYGIQPGDRCFMIWGHAAKMDSRWKARAEEVSRRIKDSIMGYHRVSAYRLDPAVLSRSFDRLLRFRPRWIYSYSSSLLSFVRANQSRKNELQDLALKACICAAEPMSAGARDEVSIFFNCPVGIEYGSVEMRVCAHTHPEYAGYYVFAHDYLIEGIPTSAPGVYDVAVTKLFPSAMPLVRYLVGDQILVRDAGFQGGPVAFFDDVYGRTNDNLVMPDGAEIHSETITHAVRAEPGILAFQLHQFKDRLELHLVMTGGDIPGTARVSIMEKLGRIHPAFHKLDFKNVPDLETTSAGKRRWVVRHQ